MRPDTGFLNDPNGPIEVDGVLHLYFQDRATTDLAEPVRWGHATSTDFARWVLHEPAMTPSEPLDRDGCWSGNTVAADGGIVAFHSGFRTDRLLQTTLRRDSADGAAFGAPRQVLPDPDPDLGVVMFRDPFVWRDGDGWAMVVGAGDRDERAAALRYRSADLEHWEPDGLLAAMPRTRTDDWDSGAGWECPQVLTIDGETVLVVGTWSEAVGAHDLLSIRGIGEDGGLRVAQVDHGPNLYAASVLRDSRFGPVLFGWVTESRPAAAWPGWAGAVSLPRTVALDGQDRLRFAPVPAIEALRSGGRDAAGGAAIGPQAELLVRAAGQARVRIEFGPDEHLDVLLDPDSDTVVVDATGASLDDEVDGAATVAPAAFAGDASVRVFLDGSIVEVFTGGGRAITTRVYPTAPPPWRVDLEGGTGTVWDVVS